VRAAVVTALGETRGNKRLVAYFVPKPGQNVAADDLRQFLEQKLPDYMVPTALLSLEALPLTSNGKVDVRALPDPARLHTGPAVADTAPRTQVEQAIAGVWQEVLSLSHIGRDDNFFDLGGDSARMVRVQSKLRDVLQRDIPMLEMFSHPTIGALAEYLSQERNEPHSIDHIQTRAARQREAINRQRERMSRRTETNGER
jgi:acyl carrier protein